MTRNDDDLLRPTLQQQPARSGASPWRLGSQLWVWFFGGPMAGGAIALVNAGRLGVSRGRKHAIIGVAMVTLAGWAALVYQQSGPAGTDPETRSLLRFASRAIGLAGGFASNRVLRDADRAFQALDPRGYASLWAPGLAAVAVGAVTAIGIFFLLAGSGSR